MYSNVNWICFFQIKDWNFVFNFFIFFSLSNIALTGEPSLQNTLEMAGRVLKPLPGHASRELLVLFASLTTCDPGDINTTIQTLKTDGIRCSVIGLAAEVRICKKLCQDTGGDYGVSIYMVNSIL